MTIDPELLRGAASRARELQLRNPHRSLHDIVGYALFEELGMRTGPARVPYEKALTRLVECR